MPHFRPADQALAAVPAADVVLITGTKLLNDTLEGLRIVPPGCTRRGGWTDGQPAAGASLRRGVDVLGGVRVTAADAFLDTLSEGGSGYHFFGRSAEKVVLLREAARSALQSA